MDKFEKFDQKNECFDCIKEKLVQTPGSLQSTEKLSQ